MTSARTPIGPVIDTTVAPTDARVVEALLPQLLLTQEHHMCPGCGEPLALRGFLDTLAEAVDDAFVRQLSTTDRLERTLWQSTRGHPRRGQSQLRSVLEVWTPGPLPGSVAEMRPHLVVIVEAAPLGNNSTDGGTPCLTQAPWPRSTQG